MNRIQGLRYNPFALLAILIPLIAYIPALRDLSLLIHLSRI
jgi:hypothetical protein